MGDIDLAYAIKLPPKDAIAYFRSKGYQIGWNWQEVWQEQHTRAFTVAKATSIDVLETIRQELDTAISEGTGERGFIKTLAPKLQKQGWWGKQEVEAPDGSTQEVQLGSVRRLKTIYRTNTSTAYASARYKRLLEQTDRRPYWQYMAIMDGNTRPSHAALNGRVFRWDDPIWQTHFPPNGWGCRCRVIALTEAQLKAQGLTVGSSEGMLTTRTVEAGEDKLTGEIYFAERTTYSNGKESLTPDAGWNYNVGMATYGTDINLARKLTAVGDVDVRAQAVQALNNSELRQKQFAHWVDEVLAKRRAGHSVQTLGFLDESIAQQVALFTRQAPARVLVINEKQLIHADSKKHHTKGIALTPEQYHNLPQIIANPEAVLWDKKHQNLLYVVSSEDDEQIKVVVNAPYKIKGQQSLLDVVINTFKVKLADLKSDMYELLEGNLGK